MGARRSSRGGRCWSASSCGEGGRGGPAKRRVGIGRPHTGMSHRAAPAAKLRVPRHTTQLMPNTCRTRDSDSESAGTAARSRVLPCRRARSSNSRTLRTAVAGTVMRRNAVGNNTCARQHRQVHTVERMRGADGATGPHSNDTARHTAAQCERLNVAYLVQKWQQW